MNFRTRFAPSPTGPLHLGHAYSALLGFQMAQAAGGAFLVRIEDIDRARARPKWEAQIFDDLAWLGVAWDPVVLRQSERLTQYRAALRKLWAMDLLYPCTCTRRDIELALQAPQEGAPMPWGPDGLIYPGTCRPKPGAPPLSSGPLVETSVLRLDMAKAIQAATALSSDNTTSRHALSYEETGQDPGTKNVLLEQLPREVGDVVICRKDMGTSYHLSVVLDDATQEITHVVRGEDLAPATPLHVLLQRLLGLPTPRYHHHRLIRDANGKRLAKRDDARALATYRAEGMTRQDLIALLELPAL